MLDVRAKLATLRVEALQRREQRGPERHERLAAQEQRRHCGYGEQEAQVADYGDVTAADDEGRVGDGHAAGLGLAHELRDELEHALEEGVVEVAHQRPDDGGTVVKLHRDLRREDEGVVVIRGEVVGGEGGVVLRVGAGEGELERCVRQQPQVERLQSLRQGLAAVPQSRVGEEQGTQQGEGPLGPAARGRHRRQRG